MSKRLMETLNKFLKLYNQFLYFEIYINVLLQFYYILTVTLN